MTLFERWLDCFQAAFEDPAGVGALDCPDCGQKSLVLTFEATRLDDEVGTAWFWCHSCLRGLAPNKAPLPPTATIVLRGTLRPPNFSIVVPE